VRDQCATDAAYDDIIVEVEQAAETVKQVRAALERRRNRR
jgi:hypothetical protein